ncbi:MAG: ankyrin repeat domain-containing protein [Spirochaetales bacterium]|nr:ankyrin repeat domain-containing protein [Spirochaetales bacterium]
MLRANRVSGLYDPPVRSVRFGNANPYSFIPVGWSDSGQSAFMIHNHESGEVLLTIFDAVEDKSLYVSETFFLSDGGIPSLWYDHQDAFSQKLGEFSILPDGDPSYGPAVFSWGNDEYSIYNEVTNLPGNRGIASLSLLISSEKKGMKKVTSYIHKDEDVLLLDSSIAGYYLSSSERRILVISLDDLEYQDGKENRVLRFNGAHLTIGYVRERNENSGLIDAVLSGQYYTARSWLNKGSDPGVEVEGIPLLFMAAEQGNWDIVFLLMENGASPAAVDNRGRILLHYAAGEGNREAVVKLLALGMNRKFRDEDGRTPADLAEESGFYDLVPLLKN